ncbi:WHG domain-containing protein [Streptomyces sp. NBC_00400]|uniref:TetR-like C-terminal domain-containing protein n=1 Tax=Streptomyces sp. NBC_00400 TaxID=2975737 RepID=UPI002E1B9E5A
MLFGGVQSFDPSGEVGTGDPIRPLLTTIDRALAAPVLVGEATSIALSIWAALHGLVTLEPAGALDAATAEAAFRPAMHATLRGWATPAVFRSLRQAELAP